MYFPQVAAASKSESKPNIILVLTDNFGYGEIDAYGGGVLRGAATPNIDSIATIDRDITDRAIDFIARKTKKKQPFFVYVPYTQTHEPVDAHPDFKGKTGNGSFADVPVQTDAYVGEGIKRSFGFTGPWRGTI